MTSNLVTRIIVIIIVMALAALCISLNWPVKLGIDLRGGSILTYEVQELQQGSDGPAVDEQGFDVSDVDETIAVISQRINAQGLADIQVRRAGDSYIELVLPDVSKEETDDIRQKMTQVGQLLFPIAAQAGDKAGTAVFNEQQFNQAREAALRAKRPYKAPDGFAWYPIRPERAEKEAAEDYAKRIEKYENDRRTNLLEVNGAWMYFDPDFWDASIGAEGITGKMIKDVRRDTDQNGGRSVTYKVEEADQANFAVYTDRYTNRSMAVVLNGEIWSQANINGALKDNVQIYKGGGGYTESEQSWLINCLKSGSLKLKPELVSQDEIAATLGKKAIDRGMVAFLIGLIAVIGMMFVYYRTSGMFAVFALMVNFMLIFGVLMVLEASLTLPGIAGLILTVGMAVDANILIFERIREELSKGKTVIQSAKNGFDRAFVTIFDANLTTFIVAAFLVYFGQGPIKGFGYTLMVGIICSMFSALYITRTLMGLAIKKGWMENIKYGQILNNPKINFQAMFKKAAVLSVALVIIGLGIFFSAGDRKYGLDFTGGTSLRMNFNEPISEQEIKDAVAKIKNADGKQKYQKIEIAMISPSGGKSTEVKLDLDYVRPEKVDDSAEGQDEFNAIEGEILAQLGDRLAAKSLQAESFDQNTGTWTATLNLLSKAEQTDILGALESAGYSNPRATAGTEGKIWQLAGQVNADSEGQAARSLVEKLRKNGVDFSRPFEGTRFVGPRVVADLATSAISAMFASLFFILAYIWFRFQELKFGFAAAVALVHDVSIALGLTVLANMTGIIHVPITLNVIAAFLTIIGYSLNDTIVVFDRIRENRDNMRGSFGDVVNRSVNQTLSRTILTSITTAFVVLAVLVCNLGIESPLEGFAFTLLIGVIVGTYSSVFVASPLLIWAHNRESESKATAPAATARS